MEGDSKSIVSVFASPGLAVAHRPTDQSDWSISALISSQQPHLARSRGHTSCVHAASQRRSVPGAAGSGKCPIPSRRVVLTRITHRDVIQKRGLCFKPCPYALLSNHNLLFWFPVQSRVFSSCSVLINCRLLSHNMVYCPLNKPELLSLLTGPVSSGLTLSCSVSHGPVPPLHCL